MFNGAVMATVKKGMLTKTPLGVNWNKHISKYWKRVGWKKERAAGKKQIQKDN